MARKFLYAIAIIVGLVVLATVAIRAYWQEIVLYAFVPPDDFDPDDVPPAPDYTTDEAWATAPGAMGNAAPDNEARDNGRLAVDVFFIHPTTYLSNSGWNAAIDDERAREFLNDIVVKYEVSIFNHAARVYAPRYRQATLGFAFRNNENSRRALDLAYRDVVRAFDRFVVEAGDESPFILAGHSQGARHALRLLAEKISGTSHADRLVAAYIIGMPLSLDHDLAVIPDVGICKTPTDTGCIATWQSYAEGADPWQGPRMRATLPALDGSTDAESTQACVNPVTWRADREPSEKAQHKGLVTNILPELPLGDVLPASLTARCGEDGYLYVTVDQPERFTRFQMMSGNLHFYDMTLFYQDIRENVAARLDAFQEGAVQ